MFNVQVSCSCNLHVYQHFSTLPPQTQTLPPACHGKEKPTTEKDDNELRTLNISLRVKIMHTKIMFKFKKFSHCVLQRKQQYIFNIFLQLIVLPQFFFFTSSMSAVIKENTKKQIWSLFTRTRNFRTIKAEGSRRSRSFDKGRHFFLFFLLYIYFFAVIFKNTPCEGLTLCMFRQRFSHQDSRVLAYW